MMKLPRIFVPIFILALILSACVAPAAPAAPAAATEVATTEAASTETAPTETATEESAEATSAEARTIQHVMGEITLPTTPQRVVVLEWSYLEDVLVLGVQPVGVADIEGYNSWVKIAAELGPDVVDVGTRQAPGLETIATLEPDLIIAAASRVTENYDELSAIAPTLVFDNYPTDKTHYESMVETVTTLGDVLGRQSEAEAALAQMEAKFADARAQLEAAGKLGEKFALAQAYTSDNVAQVRIFTDNALAVQVISQIGLENGWTEADQPFGFSTVSVEALPELGDLNFFYVVQDGDNIFVTDAVAPLWANLEFVKNNHAYPLGGDTWLFGGPQSIELLVELVLEAMLAQS